MMENTLTTMVSANHRPGRLRDVGVEACRDWRRTSLKLASRDFTLEFAEMFKSGSEYGNYSKSAPVSLLLKYYGGLLANLAAEPMYVRDVGENLKARLHDAGYSSTWANCRWLGYPREALLMNTSYDNKHGPFMLPGTALTSWPLDEGLRALAMRAGVVDAGGDDVERPTPAPGTFGQFGMRMADTAMVLDRAMWSLALVPDSKKVTDRTNNEPLFGELRGVGKQMKRLTSFGLLYEGQGDAAPLRWDQSAWSMGYDMAWEQLQGFRPVLDMFGKLREELMSVLPVHPLLEAPARYTSKVVLETAYGTSDAYVRHVPHAGAMHGISPTGGEPERLSSTNTSPLAMMMVTAAFAEFGRLSEIASSGAVWPREWVNSVGQNMTDAVRERLIKKSGQSTGGGVMFSDALHRLNALSAYTEMWPEMTRALGWDKQLPALTTTIHANGCDFTLTDGDGWSDDPVAVMAGLKPSLPIGNPKSVGISVIFEKHFGTGPKASIAPETTKAEGLTVPAAFEWNIVTTAGYMSALDGPAVLTKFYMPPGMLMGEEGGEPRFSTEEDPAHVAVGALYANLSPQGYVRQWATVTPDMNSIRQAGNTRITTDWDVWVTSGDSDDPAATRMLLDAYPDGVDPKPEVYIYREAWNMRIPVRLTRANCYEQYDELGAYKKTVDFEGFVVFGGEPVDLRSFGTTGVQAVVDLLKATAVDGAAGAEAKPPTDPDIIE
jgi:hypothetical protein